MLSLYLKGRRFQGFLLPSDSKDESKATYLIEIYENKRKN